MSGPRRFPEMLLDVAQLSVLTGEHRNTVIKRFKENGEWYRDGVKFGATYRLPVSCYNRWLASKRLSLAARKEALAES